MTKAKADDVIRTTQDVPSHFDGRTIAAGTEGLVLEVNPSGGYLVEVTLRPATDNDDGDFDQATLTDGQFDVIAAS
jgi:hypothetical protein